VVHIERTRPIQLRLNPFQGALFQSHAQPNPASPSPSDALKKLTATPRNNPGLLAFVPYGSARANDRARHRSTKKREHHMKKIIATSFIALALAGCSSARDTRIVDGALLGGAGGAIIGGVATGTAGGALAGGAIGAAGGAIIADATRPSWRGKRCYYSEYRGREICRYR
jgi:hypothetical protein